MDNNSGSAGFWPNDVSSLLDKDGVLTIDLVGEDERHVRLVSETYLAYRKADEGDVLKRASREWLHHVQASDFSKWLEDESFGNRSAADFQHYTIITSNSIVDILCLDRPTLRDTENGKTY